MRHGTPNRWARGTQADGERERGGGRGQTEMPLLGIYSHVAPRPRPITMGNGWLARLVIDSDTEGFTRCHPPSTGYILLDREIGGGHLHSGLKRWWAIIMAAV